MVEMMACEMNYKSLSIVIINSYINDNYESPMNQPINNNGTMLSQGVHFTLLRTPINFTKAKYRMTWFK
jgi:hypothetical protein